MISDKHLTENLNHYLHCSDHSISQERFELMKNDKYDLLVTQPVPKQLSTYYESEAYISHTDGKKNLFEKIYQIVKTYTLRQKLKLINKQQTNKKRLLDIGAGTGEFLKYCNNNNWQTNGVEPSQHARKLAKGKNIKLFSDISEINENKYDIITLWHVLEHIPNLTETLERLKNMLDVGGRLIIAVPNYKSNDAKYYGPYWAAYDVPRHLWHFSQRSISLITANFDMEVESIIPMRFDAYYVSLLSEKYKTGHMRPFSAFYRGFLSNLYARRNKQYSSNIFVLKKQKK